MDITFFEIHLDGAQFGPKTIGEGMLSEETMGTRRKGRGMMGKRMRGKAMREETAAEKSEEADGAESGERNRSPSRFLPLVVIVGLAVGYAVSRRFRGGDEEMADADAEPVEIEA